MSGENAARAIGARIRAARDRAGLGQKQLARRTGLSVSTIGRYERGLQTPSWRALESVADVLAVPLDWLRLGRPPAAAEGAGEVPDVVPVVEEITLLLGRLRVLVGLPETAPPTSPRQTRRQP
jgi:transcriptional regulator with XRE-family HTH domain